MRRLIEQFKFQLSSMDSLNLQEWRELFSRMMIMVFAVGFPIVLAVTFPVYFREQQYGLMALDVMFWVYLLFLAFAKVRSYRFSALLFLILMYAILITFLVKLGPVYTRPAWLVVCPVFAVLSLGLPIALGAIAFNVLILLLIFVYTGSWIPSAFSFHSASFEVWGMFVINITLITLAVVIPIGFSLKRLDASLREVRKTHAELSEKTEKLKQAYASLEAEIEERKRVEAALRESEFRYRLHFENVTDVIYSIGMDFRIQDISPSVERVTGYKPGEIIGKNFWEAGLVAPEYKEEGISHIRLVLSEEKRDTTVIEFLAKDGRRIFGEVTSSPVYQNGQLIGLVGVARNITERRMAEKALKESEERYRAIVENSHDGVVILDDQHRVIFANKRFCEIIGYTCEEVEGSDFRRFLTGDSLKLVEERYLKRQRGEEVPTEYEIEFVTKTGEKRWFELRPTIVRGPGKRVRTIGLIMDVTARRRAEEERARLQAQLLQAQKMDAIGRLAGGVAHDFNNMLGVIIGHAEMALLKLEEKDPLYGEFKEILKAAHHSKDIAQQLLAFARKQTVSPKIIDLNETVEGTLKMIRRLTGEDIDLIWKPGSNLWPIRIDPMQLRQVLVNLCVNARDAIEGVGKMTIETQNVTLDETFGKGRPYYFKPGDYVMLAVSDSGCGIPHEVQERIFDPFFTTKGNGKGTGLGLSMVYGMVKQNKGYINVYSELGIGTTFKIYLPRQRMGMDRETLPEGREKVSRGHGQTVLLAEDEEAFLELLETILTNLGYQVLSAETPSSVIRIAKEHQGEIHLLITDVIMPEMNGKDLAKEVKTLRPRIKILYMSGYTADVIAHQGILEEGVNFIQKPFTMKGLAKKVASLLRQET